jgi:hypothetical protein
MARKLCSIEAEANRLAGSLKRVLLTLCVRETPVTSGRPAIEADVVLRSLQAMSDRLGALERILTELHEIMLGQRLEKEWYTTAELAEIVGKSQFTIQERWCNDGRIECEKDPDSGKWRIPGHEVRRLRAGGGLLPRKM